MAYLYWSKQEDIRVETKVATEILDDPTARTRKGVNHAWRNIEEDISEQKVLYSLNEKDGAEDCIVVR